MEILGNQLSRYGAIANPIALAPSAKTFFVLATSNARHGDLQNEFRADKDGVPRVYGTIDAAIGACVANRGDVIYVMPGHTETVSAAAGIVVDVAGVSIIGFGRGSLRPVINFTTAVGADMDIDAADVYIENIRFTGGVDALTGPIDVNASGCTLKNIETQDVTGQAVDFIVADANADYLTIDGWEHIGAAAAGADTAITVAGADNVTIKNFRIDGNFAVAAIENTAASVNFRVYGDTPCFARTRNAADVIVTLHASTTGDVGPNINARLQDNAANITEAFVGAAAQFFQPINIVNSNGEASMQTNITASTDA